MSEMIIGSRYCGPPDSGNGGWTAGILAGYVHERCPDDRSAAWPVVQVTLRQPPPLDTPLLITDTEGGCVASFGGAVIAEARVLNQDAHLTEVDPVPAEAARAAEESYAGNDQHAFGTCVVCGPARETGDGMRIFPGPVGEGRVAGVWTPHASFSEDWHEYTDDARRASLASTWAALDCPSAWAAGMANRVMVLGRMTTRIDTLPVVGEEHVVVGEVRGQEGRKSFTATTLYDADGRVVGTAEHVWIEVDPASFGA